METFITPIQMGSLFAPEQTGTSSAQSSGFADIFRSAVDTVKDTENTLANEQYLLATGQSDDPSSVTIAASEAQMSVELLVNLRNKALESYNTLINMQI